MDFQRGAISSEIFYQKHCCRIDFNKESFWEEYYFVGLASMGFPSSDAITMAKKIVNVSNTIQQKYCLIDGVYSLLLNLKDRGFSIGVISNWNDKLEIDLEKLGIRKFFNYIISSDVLGVEKPNHEIFQHAILEHNPSETLMVGDLYYIDIKPALEVGMHAVLYDSVNCLDNLFPCKTINSLNEINHFLV